MLSFALSESLIIISLSLPFVKYFLKIFFRKFSLFPWLALEQPIHYITFSSLCQVLFSKFSFKKFFLSLTPSEQPIYYITSLTPCQYLFKKFFSDFFAFTRLLLKILPMLRQQAYSSLSPVPSRRLNYYSTHSLKCQHGLIHNIAPYFLSEYV